MNVRSFALRGSLLLLLSLSASVAAVKPRPSVTVEPRPLRMPYLWGIRGDREATITFTNPTDTEILLARGGIEILLGDPAIETVLIATLHPPVEPLLLDPGQSLAWRWKVPGSIAEPVPAVGADHLLTVRGRYAPAAAPAQLDEVTTRLALRAPPAGYRWLRSHLPSLMLQLVLAALGGRFLLALIRITRRPTSRSQREPGTAPEAALLKLLAVVGIAIARPRLSTRARLRLLLPALTFARWQAFSGGPVEARLRLLGRCEQILGDVDPGHLPPVNPVFLLHWETAEALDQRARSQATEWAESAEKIALRYQQAARFSQDRRLRALCWELAEFYQLVRQRFGSRRRPVAAADAPRPDPGAARSVWWASELLRRNLEGGPAAVLETLKLIPADVQNLPILTWAAGSAGSWPPPPAGLRAPVAGPLSKKQQAIRNAERYLRQGEIGRGMIETTKIFNATSSFPTILEQEGGAVACRALLTAARAFAEHHRFLATLPFSGKERRQHLAATFEFIAMMDRVLRKNPPVDDPAAAAMVFGLAGDLAAIQGRYPQALQNLEMIRVFSRFPDRRVLEARAVAERVRGEIYQGCGSTARAGKALAEAADWCALLGDWTRWLETNAYRLRVRLAEFEQGRSTEESVAAASQRLDEMAAAAAMVVAKRGLADLFDAWASWGAYLLARRAQDQVTALAAVLDRVQPSGAKSGWGIPEILLGRILVFRSVRKVVTISLPRAALPSLLGPGYAFWRARRQTHTTLVLGNLHFHLGMVEKGSGAATVFGRKAKKLISTGRLDLPDSIRLQIEAATLLAEWEHSSGRPSKRLANAVDLSIEALNSLTAEIDSAPVGSLRRIASVRSVDVLSQLLRSLDAARSVLDGEELDRVVATAYRALQRLRAQEWEKLLAQKIVGSGSSEPDGRIDQHLRLQRRLVFVRDQLLLQSGRLTAELRAEATRLSRQVPELACELSPESVSRALDRLREELDEMMRRKAEAGAPIAPPPRPAIPGEDHVKVPEGCAVVEYFKTPERACAFVLKGGCDRIRYLPLEVIEIPKLEQLSGELVRSVRDLGRLPAPPAPELPAGLARFESALQTIARAYWPASLHEQLAGCRRIYVVPWDDLWRIPFAALPTPAGEPLVRDRTLALLPSIHSLENLSFRPPTIPQDQISVLAYDSTRGSPNALTNMEAEVELLRRRLPRARIVEKDEASPGAALSLVEASRWLHVACHGHTDQDAVMFSRLALAADREHPDGSWYLYELEGFHEGLEGVFLNACDSNLGDMVGDRPETLAFAFLSAGAQAVVGTLGKIFDDVALELVRLFYGQLGSLRPEEALSLCLQQLIGSDPARTVQGSTIPLAHPAAWWPFAIILQGKPGERSSALDP